MLLSFPISGLPGAGSLPPWLSPWSPAGAHPQGRPLGSAAVPSLILVCCNSGGEVSAHPPSLRSPEPLYTKQPPQSGLNFREAVSVEAAARDFSMCFQVKSRPFQLCQETAPPFPLWLPPGVRAALGGEGERACRATSSHKTLPQASRPRPHRCPHPRPGTLFPSTPPS